MKDRLTEQECWDLFMQLFPNGLDDPGLLQKLAPEGWERSALLRVHHPTAEQVFEETLRFQENLARLRGSSAPPREEPRLTLDDIRRDQQNEAPHPVEECADLLGRCLWDVFADNHDVTTSLGALVDLGSFRSAAGFIAEFRNRKDLRSSRSTDRMDYIDFYLGTAWIGHRADLTPVYELIFRRMHHLGLDWRYVHPRLMALDLNPLLDGLESDDVPDAIQYDPTESFWQEREGAARSAEFAELRRCLDEAYRESVEQARNNPPPTIVRAYYQVYGRWPDGWPPDVDAQL